MTARSERFSISWDISSPRAGSLRRPRTPVHTRSIALHLVIGGGLIALVVGAAVLAPLLAQYDPAVINSGVRLMPPSLAHPFGTDAFGRDLFSRIVYGARLALRLSLFSALLSAIPGILMGLLAGYIRGWVDGLFSRLMDAWLALPGLLLALLVIARTGPSLDGAILALGITGIPSYYRLVRSAALSISKMPYVEASRALGGNGFRIIFSHILPNIATSLIVFTTLRLGTFLLAGGSLSFIGLGAQPPVPEWGAMLSEGRDYFDIAWWMFVFPFLSITMTVMGFNLLGDGLRDRYASAGGPRK